MTLYSGLSLFIINLFTRLVPRRLFPLFAAATGWLVYLFVPLQRRGMRENLRTVTGRRSVELLVLSAFYKYSRNWADTYDAAIDTRHAGIRVDAAGKRERAAASLCE